MLHKLREKFNFSKAIYKVRAKFNFSKAKEFYEKLTDGTIQKQKPDGYEIVNAMNRATIDSDDYINWTELCYCPSPLYHERTTVYDHFFSEMEIESIDDHEVFEGQSFMDKLAISVK